MTDPAGERPPRRRGPTRPGAGPAAGGPEAPGRVRAGADRAARGGSATADPSADAPKPPRPPKAGKPGKPGTPGKTGKGEKGRTRKTAEPQPARGHAEPPVRASGGQWRMADRSVLPTVLGLPPPAAVGIAAALTAVGVLVDLLRIGALGSVFTVCYVSGCVLAVAWVRRSGLFGPVVQPPLLVAVSVPVVVLLAGSADPGQGMTERLLTIGAPLVNAFPVMALTTGAVLLVGLLRVILQRPLR